VRRWPTVLLLALLVAGLLGACPGDQVGSAIQEEGGPPEGRGPGGDGGGGGEEEAEPVQVELLEAGAEPRQELRLKVAEGSQQQVTMRVTMNLVQEIDGQARPPVVIPPVDLGLLVQVGRQRGPNIHAEFAYQSVTIVDEGTADPAVVQGMRQSGIERLAELTGEMFVNTRGELLDASVDLPADFPAQLAEFVNQIESQLRNLAVPFPAEPIGAGARWSAVTSVTVAGIEAETRSTYQLLERTGDTYKIAVTVEQTAPEQTVQSQGTEALVREFVNRGSGNADGDLTRMLPVASTVRTEGTQVMEVTQGTESGTLRQRLTMEVTLRT